MIKINFYKNLVVFGVMLFLAVAGLFNAPLAVAEVDIGLNYIEDGDLGLESGGNVNLQQLLVSIIKYLMTFLGIIAVTIILYGGFVWMTAGGNDDRVGKAKKIITAGMMGLVVILSAYAIITFVQKMATDVLDGEFNG